jgi:MSHA biogenesis protein MshO
MRPTSFSEARPAAHGFTLVELVVSIALIGILAVAAAPLLRLPLAAWMDATRRAGLSNELDTVQSKLADDLQRALPFSVRIRSVGNRHLLEMLEVRAVGRFRGGASGVAARFCTPPPPSCTAANADALEAACNETCFTSLGALDGDTPQPNDWVVTGASSAIGLAGDPYFGGNVGVAGGVKTRLVSMAAATPTADTNGFRIAAHQFNTLSPNKRFYVVSTPVTWDCNPATGQLTRRWGYAINATQPVNIVGGNAAPLATRVSFCEFRPANPLAALPNNREPDRVHVQLRLSQAAAESNVVETVELNTSYALGRVR